MKITCDSCRTIYQIADERIPSGGARANCPSCGHQIVIPGGTPQSGKSSSFLTEKSQADFGQTISYDFQQLDQDSAEISALLRKVSQEDPYLTEGVQYELKDTKTGEVFKVSEPRLVLGRSGADISVNDPEVSRKHCLVRIYGDYLVIIDQDSTNGTFYMGKRVMTAKLAFGDTFTIGNTTFRAVVQGGN